MYELVRYMSTRLYDIVRQWVPGGGFAARLEGVGVRQLAREGGERVGASAPDQLDPALGFADWIGLRGVLADVDRLARVRAGELEPVERDQRLVADEEDVSLGVQILVSAYERGHAMHEPATRVAARGLVRHDDRVRLDGAEPPDRLAEQVVQLTVVWEALLRGAVGEIRDHCPTTF